MSIRFVSMLPVESLMQFKDVLMDDLNIFLWMFLGLVFSRSLYFAMAFLQLVAVCLVVILCAFILAMRPIVASFSIHCLMVALVTRVGGRCVCYLGCKVVRCLDGLASLCMAWSTTPILLFL